MLCPNCRNALEENAEKCSACGVIVSIGQRDLLPVGTMLMKRFIIDAALGRGGFGITYRATDTNLERAVVIKEFFPREQARRGRGHRVAVTSSQQASYQKALQRYVKEARILAKIKQENVVDVYDHFELGNTAYIVMEIVEGHTLRELLTKQPEQRFPASVVEEIIGQLVKALDAIHRHKVFHLDISPDNVLQTDEGKIVLIDFGAARQQLKTDGTYVSYPHQYKLAYAPLELLNAQDVGPRSDLFELAMMAHELLSGVLPPSTLQRAGKEDKWQPQLVDERWRKVLREALYLQQEMRPASVLEWWELYHQQGIIFDSRTKDKGIVIGERPGAQPAANSPEKEGIIFSSRTKDEGIVIGSRSPDKK